MTDILDAEVLTNPEIVPDQAKATWVRGSRMNAYEIRISTALEQKFIRAKADDPVALHAYIRGLFEVSPDEARTHTASELLRRANDGAWEHGDTEDGVGHQGEILLWEKPRAYKGRPTVRIGGYAYPVLGAAPVGPGPHVYDVSGPKPDYEWAGDHKVITLDEWRPGRVPNPSEFCTVFAPSRDGYVGCDQPLSLEWPDRNCEFPNQPGVWWRDDRPSYCRCNGCQPRPKGYGRRYCCTAHKREMDNAADRARRRAAGKQTRSRQRSALADVADHRVGYSTEMRWRRKGRYHAHYGDSAYGAAAPVVVGKLPSTTAVDKPHCVDDLIVE